MSLPKPWYLYLIECVDGSIYTGITVDVEARYAAHQNGRGARYTRSHAPAKLLGFEVHRDRSAASQAEYRVKRLTPAEKRRYADTLMPVNLS
jgi:putative endonuclease